MLKNMTKNTIISKDFKRNNFSKTKGLIGKDKPETLVFNTRFGIHTFFLRFPIDVLILDEEKRVVFAKNGLKPNRVFFWNPKFRLVIELSEKSIIKSKTEVGDILDL